MNDNTTEFDCNRCLHPGTNIGDADVAEAIGAHYGRWVWEELMELAETGRHWTNRAEVFDGVKTVLERSGVGYSIEPATTGFRLRLSLKDRNQAIVYPVARTKDVVL